MTRNTKLLVAMAFGAATVVASSTTAHAGLVFWSNGFGSAGIDEVAAVEVASNGDVYAYGYTTGALADGSVADFDGDVWLARFDKTGRRKFLVQFGTSADELPANQIAIASNGDVYVAGSTSGTFPGFTESGVGKDTFVAAFDRNGVRKWLRQIPSTGDEVTTGLARSAAGDLYVTLGSTGGFPSGSRPAIAFAGSSDAVIARLDRLGRLVWAVGLATPLYDIAAAVTVSSDGRIYVAGSAEGDIDGAGPAIAVDYSDAFAVALTRSGDVSAIAEFGTDVDDEGAGIALGPRGRVYVVGSRSPGPSGNGNDLSEGELWAFDRNLQPLWANEHGTLYSDPERSARVAKDGSVLVGSVPGGTYPGETQFGGGDVAVLRFDATGSQRAVRQLGTIAFDGTMQGIPIALTRSGDVVLGLTTFGVVLGGSKGGSTDVAIVVIPAP